MILRKLLLSFVIALTLCRCCYSQWLKISNVRLRQEPTELAGPKIIIEYDINDANISPESPAYVFVRYTQDSGKTWQLVPMDSLRGNGSDIVDKPGHKQIIWWGTDQTSFADANQVDVRIRGIAMARIPAGKFVMKSLPGGGRDESKEISPDPDLSLYYMAKNETTISM
jgi:hypothetical protein